MVDAYFLTKIKKVYKGEKIFYKILIDKNKTTSKRMKENVCIQ